MTDVDPSDESGLRGERQSLVYFLAKIGSCRRRIENKLFRIIM
jgi:hypothetical protein